MGNIAIKSGIRNLSEDATPQLGGQLDVNGNAIGDGTNELLTFTEDASAVNHVNIENQATGGGPIISAAGDDTNIDLNLVGKGTGNVKVGVFTFDGDQSVGAGTDNYVLTYDDATGLVSLEAAAGGGNVSNTGTPVDNQVAVWTNATTIEGDSALTFDTASDHLSTGTSGKLTTGTIELGAASDTTLSRSAAGQLAVEGSAVIQANTTVYDYVFIPAGAAIPRTTNGAEAGTASELATNDIMLENLAFDATTEEGVGFWITLPLGWDAGTIKCKPYWTAASGSGTVKWDFAARAYADDDAIDQVLGTEQGSTDTLLLANDMHIGPTTSALTIGGTPVDGEPFYMQVARDVATDTLAVDALLIGFTIEFARTAKTSTAL